MVHPPTTKRNTHTLCTPLYQLINDHLINGRLINGSIMIGAIWLPTSLHQCPLVALFEELSVLLDFSQNDDILNDICNIPYNDQPHLVAHRSALPMQCPLVASFCSQNVILCLSMSINRADLKTLTDCKNVSSKMVKRHSMCYSALLPPR